MSEVVKKYYSEIEKYYKTGSSTEHSYRPALVDLIKSIKKNIVPINETKITSAGRPDIMIRKGDITIGVLEAKDITESLDKKEFEEQLNRYLDAFSNFCFTNEIEFKFYKNKELIRVVKIADIIGGELIPIESQFDVLEAFMEDFLSNNGENIRSSIRLAEIMAGKARLLNNTILSVMRTDAGNNETSLWSQYRAFKNALVHDITIEEFSDMYSQTIVYGLFVARLNDNTLEDFSREEAEKLIPKSNPFLRDLFYYIAHELEEKIEWIIDDLVEIYKHTDLLKILDEFGKTTQRNDPVVHFYEDFLGLYNIDTKKARGVYYTPEPVVNFIIRGIDYLLKTEFKITDGISNFEKEHVKRKRQNKEVILNEHRVQVLDIATGTGTFLNEVIKYIYNNSNYSSPAIWPKYVEENLIPRLFGFELLMAPYTMAHLKLGLTLRDTGYIDNGQKRLNIFLTNSLEEPDEHSQSLFVKSFAVEAENANNVKRDAPIMVITGNPPYSISSSNKGDRILNLISDYKKNLNEKKINLDDDYIKFIRYAQYFIDKNKSGIIGMITNNSYIDGVTHRQMRKSLLESFDKIYIYDLHGNSRKKEKCPDGSKDENVFDIMQGVCIIFAVKTSNRKSEEACVYHYDSWGKRSVKYNKLREQGIGDINWTELKPDNEYHFFVPKNFGKQKKYEKGFAINDIFEISSSGVETKADSITTDVNENDLVERVKSIEGLTKKQIIERFGLKENTTREYLDRLNLKFDSSKITNYGYRVFDNRYIYYDLSFLSRPRFEVMKFMLKDNLGLGLDRQSKCIGGNAFSFDKIICRDAVTNHTTEFPLYVFDNEKILIGDANYRANINTDLLCKIEEQLGLKCNLKSKKGETLIQSNVEFSPTDLYDYIYAVLYSPKYISTYKEFLKINFPRIPFDVSKTNFRNLVKHGGDLRKFHLLKHPNLELKTDIAYYSGEGNDMIEKVIFKDNKVYINNTQFFDNVPLVAREFYIGGYQPAQRWFKDRIGKKILFGDIVHFQKMIVSLNETDRIMKEIDKIDFIK